jgi:hypothetical protein
MLQGQSTGLQGPISIYSDMGSRMHGQHSAIADVHLAIIFNRRLSPAMRAEKVSGGWSKPIKDPRYNQS